jgi:hypothetical protein
VDGNADKVVGDGVANVLDKDGMDKNVDGVVDDSVDDNSDVDRLQGT